MFLYLRERNFKMLFVVEVQRRTCEQACSKQIFKNIQKNPRTLGTLEQMTF
jgi:hypothetical protein